MASMSSDDKPWKTDLARASAQRRETVLKDLEECIKKAPSFEEALQKAVEMMKRKFARFSSITTYVADGENLAVQTAIERPEGPERVRSDEGPLAKAAHKETPTVVADLSSTEEWAAVGLTKGSALVAPVRTDAGLWAILEIWSDFRDAFAAPDIRLVAQVTAALGRKTPAT
jgi:putative methionine-R-sulfoxide reductase with GAF domain